MWLEKPMTDAGDPITPLLRCKSGGSIRANLNGPPLRCYVHYAASRSWPCTGPGCSLCKRAIGKRCYAYYPVIGQNGTVAILELTALTENSLITQMEPNTDYPQGEIYIKRANGKRNNPCTIAWKEQTNHIDRGGRHMDEEELKRCLMRIWQLPSPNGELSEKEYLKKLNEVIRLKTTAHTTNKASQ